MAPAALSKTLKDLAKTGIRVDGPGDSRPNEYIFGMVD
jgi:hypothetical protein